MLVSPASRAPALEVRMAELEIPDHYELLQVSPRADHDTIQRVFRHLAKRFHPDNPESGDAARFKILVEAFQVLSDPVQRARYDIQYAQLNAARWKIFDQETALNDVSADRRLRTALLSILYAACRNDASRPGIGEMDLERLLECPQEHMRFHVWYLKENGWIWRTENGTLAITASGVDRVLEMGGPARGGVHLLDSGESAKESTSWSKPA
jgi:curved DNA-binding protein CbpA